MSKRPPLAGDRSPHRRTERSVVWLAAGVALVTGALLALALAYLRGQAIENGQHAAESFARIIEEQTTRTLQATDQRLQLAAVQLARAELTGTLDASSARALLQQQIKSLPFVRAMWVLDARGRIAYDSDSGNIGVDLSDRDYFRAHHDQPQTGFHLGAPVRSRATGDWLISASRPLQSGAGRGFQGVVIAALQPMYFDQLWRSIDLGQDGSVALIRRDGMLMMRSPYIEAVMGTVQSNLGAVSGAKTGQMAGHYQQASVLDGVVRNYAFRALSAQPDFLVIVGQSYESALAGWQQMALLATLPHDRSTRSLSRSVSRLGS